MFTDLRQALSNPYGWLYPSWIVFLINYRRTFVGPLWILVGPAFFILCLGTLFSVVMNRDINVFIPHLAIGFIVWTYIAGILASAPQMYIFHRPILMQGTANRMSLVLRSLTRGTIIFLHHLLIIIAVMIYFQIAPTWQILYLVPAMALIVVHGIWITTAMGILGARYHDIKEISEMVIRVGFLATPIIWMADGADGRSAAISKFLLYNPFYHVLEPFRSALLGKEIATENWLISIAIAVVGLAIARLLYNRFQHLVVLWV